MWPYWSLAALWRLTMLNVSLICKGCILDKFGFFRFQGHHEDSVGIHSSGICCSCRKVWRHREWTEEININSQTTLRQVHNTFGVLTTSNSFKKLNCCSVIVIRFPTNNSWFCSSMQFPNSTGVNFKVDHEFCCLEHFIGSNHCKYLVNEKKHES